MRVTEPKLAHQGFLRLIFFADDPNYLIKLEVSLYQAIENVQPLVNSLEPIAQSATHGLIAIRQPLLEQADEVLDLRPLVQANDVQVNPVVLLKVGAGKQMAHQPFRVHSIGTRHQHQAGRILVIRLVAQVGQHRQLLSVHLLSDLLKHLGGRRLVRQRRDHQLTALLAPDRPGLDTASPGPVDLPDLGGGSDDLCLGWKVRPLDVGHHIADVRLRLVQQMNTRRHHFVEVVRRDVGGHSYRNPGTAVEQNKGRARRQQLRLVDTAVEIGREIHGPLARLA